VASDYTVTNIDDIEAIYQGSFRRARAALGASAFGMQVIDMPPNIAAYPEHDHTHDGQEEVYAVLRGGGEIEIDGERHPLDPDHLARCGPGVKRKVFPGPDGMRLMVIGGVPGAAFEAKDFTELGAPDPFAA
jgi:mannose-6-phosphate isomerase-like protein (cupin superfamily)